MKEKEIVRKAIIDLWDSGNWTVYQIKRLFPSLPSSDIHKYIARSTELEQAIDQIKHEIEKDQTADHEKIIKIVSDVLVRDIK